MTASHRKWLARLFALNLIVFFAFAIVFFIQSDNSHQNLVAWTGEEDSAYQVRALGYLALSVFQPPRNTADFVPLRYTDMPPFGVNTFFEQEVEETKIRAGMQLIRDAGFHFIRQEFPWEDIEQPAKGQFWDVKFNYATWDKYDRLVALANEYNLEIVARLDHPPDWTRHDAHARGNFAPPDNFDDYGDFVAAVVSRYRGKIKYYQLWNEPNIYPEWGEQPVNAAEYVRLLKIGYARAKAADSNTVIISAGLAQTIETGPRNVSDLIFLQQMYDAGAHGNFDILAVQDYGLFTGPGDRRLDPQRTNFSRPILIRELMVKNGDADKPIWAMEVGWNALPDNFTDAPFGRVTEAQQARYAAQAYARAQEEWPWMGPMMYWFFKRADDRETDQPFYYFRMFDPDFTPHPVYDALKNYISSARFIGLGWHSPNHWAIDYQGNWNMRPDADNYKIGRPDDRIQFTFRGTDLELAVAQNPYIGMVTVRVDGEPAHVVDLRATDTSTHGRVTLVQSLSDDAHRAEITVTRGELHLTGIIVRRTSVWLLQLLGWPTGLLLVVALWKIRQRRAVRQRLESRRRLRARLRL